MKIFKEGDNDNKLLIKCDSPLFADEVINVLAENKIASRLHDENSDPAVGAYGAIVGIAVFVYNKDYERAKQIIAPLIKERNEQKPWCPACGSDDVVKYNSKKSTHRPWAIWVELACLGFGIVCVCLMIFAGYQFGNLMKSLVFFSFVIGWSSIGDYFGITKSNYHCNKCGKDFYHRG